MSLKTENSRRVDKFRAKRIFYLSLVSQLEPCGTNWIKTKEKFASREKIRKWKSGIEIHQMCRISEMGIV
jgi:hypothetical protein